VGGIACLGFVLLLTPTGSLPSPRWRWWARVAGAAPVIFAVAVTLEPQPLDRTFRSVTNPLGLQALRLPIAITDALASGITVAGVVVGALSLVVRFRRARSTEHQQLRWVALAAVLVVMTILVASAGMAVGSDVLIIWGTGVSFAVLLAGGYAVVVLGLGPLLGRDSSLVVAGATLTAELLAVADRTVEPTTVSLWLRPPAERLSHPTC
jgi:hypothetical protein